MSPHSSLLLIASVFLSLEVSISLLKG